MKELLKNKTIAYTSVALVGGLALSGCSPRYVRPPKHYTGTVVEKFHDGPTTLVVPHRIGNFTSYSTQHTPEKWSVLIKSCEAESKVCKNYGESIYSEQYAELEKGETVAINEGVVTPVSTNPVTNNIPEYTQRDIH